MRGKTTLVVYEGKRMTLREVSEAQGMVGEKGYQAFRKWRWRAKRKEVEQLATQKSEDEPANSPLAPI